MSDTEFRLEVGKDYISGGGEKHRCERIDEEDSTALCIGDKTGRGWYGLDGQLLGSEGDDEMTLRPIA